MEIVEHEAKIIKLIFQCYVVGDESGKKLKLRQIAQKLNGLGITTRKGKKWDITKIRRIIKSETYAGVWHYGKESDKIDNPIPVEVPAIVSREVWETAQIQIEKNKKHSHCL